ncbi:Lrp/AsnC ligand binding domain-containing protein [Nitrosopumilus sp.]|uniref:Lrp/AsnC ligand binding domain-containing protein n=1 Tax=Nitrosopumilus sp. TaxID=2024843 RepID=UPI003B5A9F54
MTKAFVLISCVLGKEEEIIENLKHTDYVKEIQGTFGAFDIIATIENKNNDKIRKTVKRCIENIWSVRSTLTLIGTK